MDNPFILAALISFCYLLIKFGEMRLIEKENKPLKIKSSKDANIIDMENQISSKIGMKVNINNKRNNSGTLTFEYKDIDQLDRIVQVIKDKY